MRGYADEARLGALLLRLALRSGSVTVLRRALCTLRQRDDALQWARVRDAS